MLLPNTVIDITSKNEFSTSQEDTVFDISEWLAGTQSLAINQILLLSLFF